VAFVPNTESLTTSTADVASVLHAEYTPSTVAVPFADKFIRSVGGVWAAPVLEQKSTSTSGSEIGGNGLLTLKPS
jgi:hypothetical protein